MNGNQQISVQQIDFNTIFNYMFLMMFLVMMFKVFGKALEPEKPGLKLPPGYKLLEKVRVTPPPTREEEIQKRKANLENIGREIAREAGVEFLRPEEGWQWMAYPKYWFRDSKGNEILARDIDELKWKLEILGRRQGGAEGTCYQDAWRFLMERDEGWLVHGSVETAGKRINHAWWEGVTGYIWEPEYKWLSREDFRGKFKPEIHNRYNPEQAAIMAARTRNYGPWIEAERQQYLKGHQSPASSSPGVVVMPKLPEEAKGDILFIQYIRDLVKLGETVTDEEARLMWEAWKKSKGV